MTRDQRARVRGLVCSAAIRNAAAMTGYPRRTGILVLGRFGEAEERRHGTLGDIFEAWLRSGAPEGSYAFTQFQIADGAPLPAPDACQAWVLTGSKFGVYDDVPWIPPLEDFIRRVTELDAPMIGVCFGHQIIAHALGGRVVKSAKGWGCGVHDYAVADRPAWLTTAADVVALHAMHQDQVTAPPSAARRIAGSAFCPNAILAYGPGAAPRILTVQGHPEFDAALDGDLVRRRRGAGIPEAVADAALATLGAPVDNLALASAAYAVLCADRTGAERSVAPPQDDPS